MFLKEIALGVIIGWILLVISFLLFLMRKYTFGKNWTPENPNPYAKETMGIPRGAFRGVLTLSILFLVMLLEVNNLFFDPKDLAINGEIFIPEDRFKALMTAFQMVIAFYFGSKVMHHMTNADKSTVKNEMQMSGTSKSVETVTEVQNQLENKGALG